MGSQASDRASSPERPGSAEEAPDGTGSADGLLVQRLRRGEPDAGYRFFREHYPAVYRYLFYLTERPEQAEDLAQETFVRAWLYLDRFDPRGSLRAWLHRIAHREFLRAPPRETPASLEVIGAVAAPEATAFTAAAALREIVRRLPAAEREAVLLHDLEGYSSREIAAIVGAPASTVRRRLAQARTRLRQELGEGDLFYLNEPSMPMRQWAWLPLDQMHALETRLTRRSAGDWNGLGAVKEETMERREFLRQAAVGAAGLMLTEPEKEVIDPRLTQKVTCAFKATALSDLCEKLKSDTGIQLTAGPSVADEKVTLFCEKLPLRGVMRQLSRPFGYTWLRSGKPGDYKYELVQDLRSQLLEEELRNRDRNAALLALEKEIEQYRPFLGLSPDEALARSNTASPVEKKLLESLGGKGWGPVQMYFKLSLADLKALRSGQEVRFDSEPPVGEQALPADVTRGVLQSWRDHRLFKRDGRFSVTDVADAEARFPDALPPVATPEAGARVSLQLVQREPGQFALVSASGYYAGTKPGHRDIFFTSETPFALGGSPTAVEPSNGAVDARLARDPALQALVTVQPKPSCRLAAADGAGSSAALEPRITSADALEEVHRVTGLPVVSDYYTHLYKPETVSVREQTAFSALSSLAGTMRLRWDKDPESGWLRFRSTRFFYDRLTEVPNRLLSRWSTARREHGLLTLDDLIEIAQLPDAQLDAEEMAEGARAIFGLAEWNVARSKAQRPHLQYLATFTSAQRREAMSPDGLLFTRMTLAQQQQFIAFSLPGDAFIEGLQSLDELAGAALRVDYQLPGWYEWRPGSWYRWVMPTADGKRVLRHLLRERTRAAALEAARRDYLPFALARAKAERTLIPEVTEAHLIPQESEVVRTTLELQITYLPGTSHRHAFVTFGPGGDDWRATRDARGKE